MLRLLAYGTFAFGAIALLAARSVYADARETALLAGAELAKLGDLTSDSEALFVNGELVHRSTATVPEQVEAVLDRYEQYCDENPSLFARALAEQPKEHLDKVTRDLPSPSFKQAVMREQKGDRGMVACFVDDRPGGVRELPGRLKKMMETGDLGELGKFRYAFAERTKVRGVDATYVTTVWCDSKLNVGKMFPSEGDAAGADSTFVPRPAGGRRILSAAAAGQPFGLFAYEVAARPEELRTFYDGYFKGAGWRKWEREEEGTSAYLRADGLQVFVSLAEQDHRTYATVVEGGRPSTPGMSVIDPGD